jgi:hypothetical protein
VFTRACHWSPTWVRWIKFSSSDTLSYCTWFISSGLAIFSFCIFLCAWNSNLNGWNRSKITSWWHLIPWTICGLAQFIIYLQWIWVCHVNFWQKHWIDIYRGAGCRHTILNLTTVIWLQPFIHWDEWSDIPYAVSDLVQMSKFLMGQMNFVFFPCIWCVSICIRKY